MISTSYKINRYPQTYHKSLKAWNSADDHILKFLNEEQIQLKEPSVFNDRFGYLTIYLSDKHPKANINYKSQEKSIKLNARNNGVVSKINYTYPLEKLQSNLDTAILKVPKSLDLFRMQLQQINQAISSNGIVICGFMTKYFSAQIVKIAGEYFEECIQSKAWKKSRLLILKKKKTIKPSDCIHSITNYKSSTFKQYYGVFSAKNIDYATQFFIEHLKLESKYNTILDLASGNGIIASEILNALPSAKVHLVDDSYLAIESSKLNIHANHGTFHFQDDLSSFQDDFFDLIVSNPPFHFEHETNIEIALNLFKQAKRCLKQGGVFQMVTSKHLNSKTHLERIFEHVTVHAENKKFIIYHCK